MRLAWRRRRGLPHSDVVTMTRTEGQDDDVTTSFQPYVLLQSFFFFLIVPHMALS